MSHTPSVWGCIFDLGVGEAVITTLFPDDNTETIPRRNNNARGKNCRGKVYGLRFARTRLQSNDCSECNRQALTYSSDSGLTCSHRMR